MRIRSLTQVESEDNMNSSRNTNPSSLPRRELGTHSIGYMPGLDGLRALAVLAVLAYHLNLPWAPGGLLGVNLFFVLSGYLITNILLKQWEHSGAIDLKDFWLRRARRLLPALFVMLTGVLLWMILGAPDRLAGLKQEALAAVSYTSNWYLIFHQVSYFESFGPPSPLGHLWSLAVEEQFYLFWPLLLGLGLRCFRKRRWIMGGTMAVALTSAAAMALIYIPGQDPSRVYYGTDTRAFALLAGAVLAMVWPSGKLNANLSGPKKLALDGAGTLGLLMVLVMIGKTNQYQTFLYQGGLLLFSVGAAGLVAALAHPASYLGRLLGWGPLRWLGECSYGIYLWHYPVILLTSPAVNTEGPTLSRTLWQIALSIILAALSRYLIEDPIRYGGWKGWGWRKPLAHRAKIAVSLGLMILLLFVTPNGGTQISAQALAQSQVTAGQVQTQAQTQAQAQQQPQGREDNGTNGGAAGTDKGSDGKGDHKGEDKDDIQGYEITAIGDSLMIDVEPVLQERLPGIMIDAQIGRQMIQAPEVIAGLQKEGKLGKIVIIELGTNGSFTEKQLTQTLDALKGAEEIVLVNTRVPRPWETEVNETLTKVAGSYPHTRLVDWYQASNGHDDYFYPDGVHLNPTGAEAYGEILINALNPQGKDQAKSCYNSIENPAS